MALYKGEIGDMLCLGRKTGSVFCQTLCVQLCLGYTIYNLDIYSSTSGQLHQDTKFCLHSGKLHDSFLIAELLTFLIPQKSLFPSLPFKEKLQFFFEAQDCKLELSVKTCPEFLMKGLLICLFSSHRASCLRACPAYLRDCVFILQQKSRNYMRK